MLNVCLDKENKISSDMTAINKRIKIPHSKKKIIGIVGGMGPQASLDLAQKILDHTIAATDQDHLPVIHMSVPHLIEDRTGFIIGEKKINPALSIAAIIKQLNKCGAEIIGIPCNTSFASVIYGEIIKNIEASGIEVRIIHLLDKVALYLEENFPSIRDVGVLCTQGLYHANGYVHHLGKKGFNAILADEIINMNFVHKSIYDPEYGIKARSNPVSEKAVSNILMAIKHLEKKGVKAIVLGCTELSLAIKDKKINDLIIVDPTTILARALIREVDHTKLRRLSPEHCYR